MSETSVLDRESDLTDPTQVLAEWRALAKRLIALATLRTTTRERAIAEISEKHGLGSWLRKLDRGDKVTDRYHLYRRLCAALETEIDEQKRRLALEEQVLRAVKGANAAQSETVAPRVPGSADGGTCQAVRTESAHAA